MTFDFIRLVFPGLSLSRLSFCFRYVPVAPRFFTRNDFRLGQFWTFSFEHFQAIWFLSIVNNQRRIRVAIFLVPESSLEIHRTEIQISSVDSAIFPMIRRRPSRTILPSFVTFSSIQFGAEGRPEPVVGHQTTFFIFRKPFKYSSFSHCAVRKANIYGCAPFTYIGHRKSDKRTKQPSR